MQEDGAIRGAKDPVAAVRGDQDLGSADIDDESRHCDIEVQLRKEHMHKWFGWF